MTTLIWIPAREGSQRLRNKNLKRVAGVSMLSRAIWSGRRLRTHIDGPSRLVVDTDSKEIAEEARAHGADVPFLRESKYAGAEADSVDALLRCLERLDAGGFQASAVVVLQPTSPLRGDDHIRDCWEPFADGAPSVVSVRRADVEVSSVIQVDDDRTVQSYGSVLGESAYCPSGAFYAARRDRLRETNAFVVPGETLAIEGREPGMLDVDWSWQHDLADGWASRDPHIARCRVIAEAGVNHNGNLKMALKLIDVAAEAGADYVKFQTFDPKRLVSRTAPKAEYQVDNTGTSESQFDMLEALALPREWYGRLVKHCAERGIGFLSTPFDEASSTFLSELGVEMLKIPSGEITNRGLLRHVAALQLPIILSTGMSTLGEVMDAVDWLRRGGISNLTVLHCVSNYPTAATDANLRAMDTMRSIFGLDTGWSDHTRGWHIAVAAAARGAAIIEKHFTLDRDLPGPDHAASLEPDELSQMVEAIREVKSALGDGIKIPRPSELPVADVARKSLHLRREVEKGTRLEADDLTALRPGTGIPPSQIDSVIGRITVRALEESSMLMESDLE